MSNNRIVLPRVIGHRGAAGHAPENTLAGIQTAARLGARWVEFDIHLSADGAPVLLHDDTLERTTDGEGAVDAMTLAGLNSLDAGSWYSDAHAGEPVPSLSAAIRLLGELGLGANVEIKPSPGREVETGHAVGRMLREEWPGSLPPPVVSSFKPEALAAAREVAPEIPRGLLVHRIERDWGDMMNRLGCVCLHARHKHLTKRQAMEVRQAGFGLMAFTVNKKDRAKVLFDWGVETMISDYPDRVDPR